MSTLRSVSLLVRPPLTRMRASGGDGANRVSSDERGRGRQHEPGRRLLAPGNTDLAIERLQRALEQNPRLADAHTTIAVAYDQIGSLEEAETHYSTRDAARPGQLRRGELLCRVPLCRQNRWADAEPYFRRAADNPRLRDARSGADERGRLRAQRRRQREAPEEYFRAALARNPVYPDALLNMIELSYQTRELHAGPRVRAALSRRTARRRPPCSGCASTSSASSTTRRGRSLRDAAPQRLPRLARARPAPRAAEARWPIASKRRTAGGSAAAAGDLRRAAAHGAARSGSHRRAALDGAAHRGEAIARARGQPLRADRRARVRQGLLAPVRVAPRPRRRGSARALLQANDAGRDPDPAEPRDQAARRAARSRRGSSPRSCCSSSSRARVWWLNGGSFGTVLPAARRRNDARGCAAARRSSPPPQAAKVRARRRAARRPVSNAARSRESAAAGEPVAVPAAAAAATSGRRRCGRGRRCRAAAAAPGSAIGARALVSARRAGPRSPMRAASGCFSA